MGGKDLTLFLIGERKEVHVNLCSIKDQKEQLTVSLHW